MPDALGGRKRPSLLELELQMAVIDTGIEFRTLGIEFRSSERAASVRLTAESSPDPELRGLSSLSKIGDHKTGTRSVKKAEVGVCAEGHT